MTITPATRKAVLDMMHAAATAIEPECGPVESREDMEEMDDEIIAYHLEFLKRGIHAAFPESMRGITLFGVPV